MKKLTLSTLTLLLILTATCCWAGSVVNLTWPPNSESDLVGYRLFERIDGQSYDYENPVWQGGGKFCQRLDLTPGETFFWVLRAYDLAGNESGDSNEHTFTIPVPDTTPPGNPVLNVPIYIQIGE